LNLCELRLSAHGVFFLSFSFSLSFADCSPLSHIPILLIPCHVSRRTPCSLRFDTSLPLLWDNPPFLAWSWSVTRHYVASHLVRDAPFHTPRSTPLLFSIDFSGLTFFLFFFFFR
jgi:hypothetical protein